MSLRTLAEVEAKGQRVTPLTWSDVQGLCHDLARRIRALEYSPEVIVGIQRGGCVPAVLLSHILGVDSFTTVGVRTTRSDSVRPSRNRPSLTADPEPVAVAGRRVLLVDDVTNTGATLSFARRQMRQRGAIEIVVAALVWDGEGASNCEAEIVAARAESWVVFPWENTE